MSTDRGTTLRTDPIPAQIAAFVEHWSKAGGAERASYQHFIVKLCEVLGLPEPTPPTNDDSQNDYVFDRAITVIHPDGKTSTNFIDLYYRAHFVLETKQGIQKQDATPATDVAPKKPKKLKQGHGVRESKIWDDALLRAKSQAENYVRSIPDDNPPFLLVMDVGYSIETYADFSGLGKTYTPFPNNLSHRFKLADLADEKRGPELFTRLQKIWTDPQSLNPAKHAAKVTREIAAKLAELSKSLEASKHHPESVAHFLMRVLFTCFAEDVHLLGKKDEPFTNLLRSLRDHPENFAFSMQALWHDMDRGGFSGSIQEHLLRFNGSLFKDTQALPVTSNQLELLIEAAEKDWSDVEPAIFGTLLERALNPTERHKLGAHYTPRAYVERLVLPTVIEPLREEWNTAKTAAIAQANDGKIKAAIKTVGEFLKHLCSVTILDPACGSGNFLYVTLEHLKRLEGEVNDFLHQFPNAQFPIEYTGLTVDPHQLRGIEINPRAAAITDLVLWIGYLQWHFRTHGNTMPQEPVLKKFDNIECRDAVLAYDKKELARDGGGKPLSEWDGKTTKTNLITGEEVPDESARRPAYLFINSRQADWPATDYIVGNPPFIGMRKFRITVGNDYVDALQEAYPEVPETSDYVMYWWHKGAQLASSTRVRRFGFITTNSVVQDLSRRIIETHLDSNPGVRLLFAIPDHPWVESADGAAVRIAMTVGSSKTDRHQAILGHVISEDSIAEVDSISINMVDGINARLQVSSTGLLPVKLEANEAMVYQGVVPVGNGFKLSLPELKELGYSPKKLPPVIRKYMIGRDLVQQPDPKFLIDFFGLSEEVCRRDWPDLYQIILNRVKPERDQNRRKPIKELWWRLGWERPVMRKALRGLKRFIGTPNTAKHRPFVFLESDVLPDAMVYAIASDDALILGVLSSRPHLSWCLSQGGTLEDRPRYTSNATFDPFPFPDCTEKQKSRIRKLAEELDAHRKRQQAKFPDLTLTDMYNILEKLRAADPRERKSPDLPTHAADAPVVSSSSLTTDHWPLTTAATIHSAAFSPKDKLIHDHGLISILKQLHDELDAAVFDAYGWSPSLTDDQLLEKLVALNHQRAAEEKRGLIKYLRPDFQK